MELTVHIIPFETGLEAAQQRKENEYLDLLYEAKKLDIRAVSLHWRWVLAVYHKIYACKASRN